MRLQYKEEVQQLKSMKEQTNELIDVDPYNSIHLQTHPQNQSELENKHQQYSEQYNSIQFKDDNLIDLINNFQPTAQKNKHINYIAFLNDRVIEIDKPQLVKQGYLTSYKLYHIKTKKKNSETYDTMVNRRFSDFQCLNEELIQNYGGYVLPRLPSKNFLTNINLEPIEFQQIRVNSLLKYLTKLLGHSYVRCSDQLKHFLFDDQFNFSKAKGQFLQNKNTLESIKNISSSVLQYGKSVYQRMVGGKQKRVETNHNSKEQIQIQLFQREIDDLSKVTVQISERVAASYQQFQILHDFTISSNQPHLKSMTEQQNYLVSYEAIKHQFQQISEFVQSCQDAIIRIKQLKAYIELLLQQQSEIQSKQRENIRNRQLDLLRHKLEKAKQKYSRWIGSLKKQLAVYASEGKTLMDQFVKKFTKLKGQIYNQC